MITKSLYLVVLKSGSHKYTVARDMADAERLNTRGGVNPDDIASITFIADSSGDLIISNMHQIRCAYEYVNNEPPNEEKQKDMDTHILVEASKLIKTTIKEAGGSVWYERSLFCSL